jgi:type VI secretion system protein ImpA
MREDLLTPISDKNPSGENLRYDRVYDQIKEARSADDETVPTGVWERQLKQADFNLSAKLAGDALAGRSKDLWLAVWLGEALFQLEGASMITPVLRLLLTLQQEFWDTLYPELDDGDPGMRVAPLQWAANRYTRIVCEIRLTTQGVDFFEYQAARSGGTEQDAGQNEKMRRVREQLIADGKRTSEEVDELISATPTSFYDKLEADLISATQALHDLNLFCEERFVDGPSFLKLRETIEEVKNVVSSLLRGRRRSEPKIEEPFGQDEESLVHNSETEGNIHAAETLDITPVSDADVIAPAAVEQTPHLPRNGSRLQVLESWSDALSLIDEAITYMNHNIPGSSLPFLLRSSMRIAELREIYETQRGGELIAPDTEVRQSLKVAASTGEWGKVHNEGFSALSTACGRAWLDLYRYLWLSCRELGWQERQRSIVSFVRLLLREIPELPRWTFNDDTPVATAETMRWISEEIEEAVVIEKEEAVEVVPAPVIKPMSEVRSPENTVDSDSPEKNDLIETAKSLVEEGQVQQALRLLSGDAETISVGRLRYIRNLQIADLCLQGGYPQIAVPILQRLIGEAEERRLESWESREFVARPYALLLGCASKVELDEIGIFTRLCNIDPVAALTARLSVGS